MLKKFAAWFVVFGLSLLVSEVFGWAEQGKAFFAIHLCVETIAVLAIIVILVAAGIAGGVAAYTNGFSFILVLIYTGIIAITLFATWGATKLFGIDFYVAYQVMTFGQCLCTNNSKSKKDD